RNALRIISCNRRGWMPRIGKRSLLRIPIIPLDELLRLWRENRMDEKRAADLLTGEIAYQSPASDPALAGVRAVIIKLLTQKGQHIGTIIEIINADNTIRDSHPKD